MPEDIYSSKNAGFSGSKKLIMPVILFLISSPSVHSADWSTFQGGPSRTGVSGESFKVPDTVKWSFNIREDMPLAYKPVEFSVPVVFEQRVYVGTSLKTFLCLSAKGGAELWRFPTTAAVESTATVEGDAVYFGDNSGTFYALDRTSGKLLWKYETGGEILASPLFVKGMIFATNSLGEVHALDASTGRKLWFYKRPSPRGFSIRGTSSPSFGGSNIYIGFTDGFVVALNPFDGNVVWEKRLAETRKQFRDIDASPVHSGDSVYISYYDGAFYSLNASDGSIKWKFEGGGAGSPAVGAKTAYIPGSGGAIFAVDKESGMKIWEHKLEGEVPSSLLLVDGRIIFGSSVDGVAVLDAESGKEIWRRSPGSGVYSGTSFSNGDLYYFSKGGFIYSISCK